MEPKIPEDWTRSDKKLSDVIAMSGEEYSDDFPVYEDSKGGIFFLKDETFGGETLKVAYRVARRPVEDQEEVDLANSDDPMARMGQGFCPPFNQRTYEAAPGIICEQDQEVVMRDGCKIYCDIYRPVTDEKIPVIVSWSWFGKRPGDGMSEWQIMGVPPKTVSNCAKFESPDPLYWCHQGYAVANVDVRGAGHSEGNVHMFTHQDREDGYDFVEWVAQRDWCNGRVGMSGNSGVAMHQWGIAAECPPHLACIAPWESTTDLYRESLFEGGVPALSFNEFIAAQVTGPNGVDDQVAMARMYPFENAYWRDKQADFAKVKIPVYQTAGWSHFHLPGSFNAWRRCKSRRKWMRAHRDFEWPDTYQPDNLENLKRFYDRYLKDIHNGWEMTPRVRLDVMDAFDLDAAHERPETNFPIERTEYKKLYLDAADMTMKDEKPAAEAQASYDANEGKLEFDYTFDEDTEITGYMHLCLDVECKGHDEMDLFVNIQKADAEGRWIPWLTLDEPHPGAWGKQRVSRRALDEKLSRKHIPILANESEEKLSEGEVVSVDIAIVPTSRVYHAGERLRVQIAGRYIREGWFEPLAWDTDNAGEHVVHTGGAHDVYLEVPVVPSKYDAYMAEGYESR